MTTSPFSQDQEAALDSRFKRLRARFTIGYCLLLVGFVFFGFELYGVINQVDASSHNQLLNRTANVASWCEGINEGRDESRKIAARLGATYKLGDLPCKELVAKTYNSPKGDHLSLKIIEERVKH